MKNNTPNRKRQILLTTVKGKHFPFLEERGFTLYQKDGGTGFYHLHQIKPQRVHLVLVQFDKGGKPRLTLRIGIVTEKILKDLGINATLETVTYPMLPHEMFGGVQ